MTINFINKYLEQWVLLCLTIFLLGFFFFPSSSKHNTFFYIGVCIPIVLLLPSYYKNLKPQSWLTASALIFAFYLFLNSLWSLDFSIAKSLKYLRYLFTLYCLFAAIFLFCFKKPNSTHLIFIAFVIVGFFESCYGIYNYFYIDITTSNNPLVYPYNDPIHSAMFTGLLLLTCFWLMLESSDYKQKLYYLCLSIPFIVIMFLSKARGPQLSFLLTILPLFYFQYQNIKKNLPILIITFLALIIFFIFSDLSKAIFSRGLSFPYRTEIWAASLRESLDYFWFGQGANHKPTPLVALNIEFDHSHNIALAVFRMGGIIGLLLFSINLTLCFFAGTKHNKSIHHLWIIWLFFGVFCLMSNGKYPLSRPSSSWLAYWIPIAFICASYSKFLPIKSNRSKNQLKID